MKRVLLIGIALAATACAGGAVMSPTAPTFTTIRVAVYAYQANVPLTVASVQVDASPAQHVGDDGAARVTVSLQRESCITASAPGYQARRVCGAVTNANELWSFWLEPL